VRHNAIDPARNTHVETETRKLVSVADRMVRPAITIRRDATAEAAWKLMKARRIRHLPVVGDDGRLVGIVTDRDLRQVPFVLGSAGPGVPAGVPVERVMTAAVITVRPETEVREAARLMHEQKLGALPVVERDRVVGILTETDLLRTLVEVLDERAITSALRWMMVAGPTGSGRPGRRG
jgi:CBS domain-containing protein